MTKEEIKKQISDSSIQVQLYGNDGQEVVKGNKAKEHLIKWIYEWIDEAIAEHEAGKTVIKAKALRKKGTDKWYVAYESGKIPNQETLYFNETRSINGAAHNYDFWYKSQNFYPPADAELIDIEITIPKPCQP